MNSIYKLAKSVLFRFTPEQAHHIILSNLDWATQLGAQKLVTRSFPENPIEIMGLRFPNCVGLAAGMDKDGEHVTAFGALGFGSVEIGTVTPKGQPGNPKPRLFRLIPDEAIINRMGFNNVGAIQVAKNLQSLPQPRRHLRHQYRQEQSHAQQRSLIGLQEVYGSPLHIR